jgi:type VI secretion system protein ImpB
MSSLQDKVGRVRPPRVQLTYKVETGGAMQDVELPFVVGVMADLSGNPKQALKPLRERDAIYIDRDNFNDVLRKAAPRLTMRVADKISGSDQNLSVELNFNSFDDFGPAEVARQIAPTRELLEMREKLNQMLVKMEGRPELESLLTEILNNTDKAKALATEMGIAADAAAPSEETQS